MVTVDEWSYPDKTPHEAQEFEEARHKGNNAMFNDVILEFSDDIKFVKPEDLYVETVVRVIHV